MAKDLGYAIQEGGQLSVELLTAAVALKNSKEPLTRGAVTRTLPPSLNHLEKVELNCKRPCLHNPF